MTAITERSQVISEMIELDMGKVGRKWLLPIPWGTAGVDRLICSLDANNIPHVEIIQKVKKQYPELANYAIPIEVLERRLETLDQRTDNDYFKVAFEKHYPLEHIEATHEPHFAKHNEPAVVETTFSPRKQQENHGTVRPSLDGTTECIRPESRIIGQALGDPDDQRTATMTTAMSRPFSPEVDEEARLLNEDVTIEEEEVILHPDTIAVRHGLAIHANKGEAWESVKPTQQFARDRSVRRIVIEEEEARDRAVKHGLAIHSNHGEKWERIEAQKVRKGKWKGKERAGLPMHSVDLRPAGSDIDGEKENTSVMPTALRVDGKIVGLAPGGTIKSNGSRKTAMGENSGNGNAGMERNVHSSAGMFEHFRAGGDKMAA